MIDFEISEGKDDTFVSLKVCSMGNDIVVTIFNKNAHIGAVALAEYAFHEGRTSVSVLTRLGHKDDAIAQKVAHNITKNIKKVSCVVVGIHLDQINESKIHQIERNCEVLTAKSIELLRS